MLAEFFESPLRIQELRDGPDGRVLEGFAQELCQAGYAEITARRHIRAAEHLIHWTGRKGRTVAALDERMIEEFVAAPESMPMPTIWPHTSARHPEGCAFCSSDMPGSPISSRPES